MIHNTPQLDYTPTTCFCIFNLYCTQNTTWNSVIHGDKTISSLVTNHLFSLGAGLTNMEFSSMARRQMRRLRRNKPTETCTEVKDRLPSSLNFSLCKENSNFRPQKGEVQQSAVPMPLPSKPPTSEQKSEDSNQLFIFAERVLCSAYRDKFHRIYSPLNLRFHSFWVE